MCMSSPHIPTPPAVQEAKPAETTSMADRKRVAALGNPAGTLLTGPSGIQMNTMNLGSNTLLGS